MSTPNLAEIRAALVIASDALHIAADWNVDRVQLEAPAEWDVADEPDEDEGDGEVWIRTRALAFKLDEIAQSIDLGIKESPPAKSIEDEGSPS